MANIAGLKIRTKEQLKTMNPRIEEAVRNSIRDGRAIPLVYQYLHKPGKELIINSDNTIGKVTNIRYDEHGDLVGDVEIIDILKIASNFVGVVDNLMASPKPMHSERDGYRLTLDGLIVYDKFAKDDILARKRRMLESDFAGRLARPGEIPIMPTSSDKLTMREVTNKLVDEFKNRVEKQEHNNEK